MPDPDSLTLASVATLSLDSRVATDLVGLDAASTNTTSVTDCLTPTRSEFSFARIITDKEISTPSLPVVTDARPKANKTFVIRAAEKPNLILTLVDGELQVVDGYAPGGGWQWRCVKNNGWYGFRNTVSGAYIGHNNKDLFGANSKDHKKHESFIIDPHEDGGYLLVMRHADDFLTQLVVANDGKSLTEVVNGGTAWEFIEPHHLVIN
ncbi:hypothetical protein PT974_08397 [Cladobotryum mycophilum]|uniref:Uncharacterized protein n=1 Tax=Cladobotryum mycophilum TaxID=491253 RepID=A0ABR0SDA7_9HYPO